MSEQSINENIGARGRRRRMVAGFGALVILALLFAAVFNNAIYATRYRTEAERWHVHTLEVLLTIGSLRAAANAGMEGERGYLITGDESFLKPYKGGARWTPRLVARLASQTSDNARQQRNIAELRMRTDRLYRTLGMIVALHRQGRVEDAATMVRSGIDQHAITQVFAAMRTAETEERALLAQRSTADDLADSKIDEADLVLIALGLLLLVIAGAAGASTMRAQTRIRNAAEQLRLSATTDELTGLANRRSFMHALEVEVARAERSRAPLSLAVVDLDHFKRINDSHGHAGGDAVLRGFAEIATETMRTGDLVARLGGEEFGILMPGTDVAEARLAAERLRTRIANAGFAMPGGDRVRVTMSSGIALLVAGEERDRLVTRADDALYVAKESGRNQVCLAA